MYDRRSDCTSLVEEVCANLQQIGRRTRDDGARGRVDETTNVGGSTTILATTTAGHSTSCCQWNDSSPSDCNGPKSEHVRSSWSWRSSWSTSISHDYFVNPVSNSTIGSISHDSISNLRFACYGREGKHHPPHSSIPTSILLIFSYIFPTKTPKHFNPDRSSLTHYPIASCHC